MKKQRQWKLKANRIPGSDHNFVTEDGRVFSTEKGFLLEMTPSLSDNGYLRVQVLLQGQRKWQPVHRLVLLAWTGRSEKPYVNHRNGIKTDNRLENLEWVTHSENLAHARGVLGHSMRGQKNTSARLTEEQVRYIRSSEKTPAELAAELLVTRECIYAVNSRRSWSHIP